MVRTLTGAEAQVIGAMLASTRVSERARLQRAAVPRSTYHAARRRAYQEGWLRDRYIPDPVQFGLPFATFVLARPYADRFAEYVAELAGEPSTVYLARSPTFLLAIGFHGDEGAAAAAADRPASGRYAGWSFPIVADLREPTVPVYFDYEGSFAHFGDSPGPEGYPQGLGGAPPDPRRAERPAEELRSSWAATELVHRPFPAEGGERPPHLVGPLGLPWGQQKMLNQGWVRHRVLLDPARLPPFQGHATDQLVLITGMLRSQARPEELFASLTRECRVYPFLFVAAAGRLLLGALGQSGDARPSPENAPRRPSVLRTLQAKVEGIEIVTEASPAFQAEVDHRYDRLFPKAGTS